VREDPGTLRRELIARRQVVAIVGPTASGKTALGLRLARRLGGAIVSADSRQVYRHLDIGTAKPTREERGEVPHHFIDILDPPQEYNAGLFGSQAREVVEHLFATEILPIIVGGSGLYVRSLVDGFFNGPGADPEFRTVMEARLQRGELPLLLEELRRVDPRTAAGIDPTKPRRIVRALEVFHTTGIPLSVLQKQEKPTIGFTTIPCGLYTERRALYAAIEGRVDAMLQQGLLDEVHRLQAMGYDRRLNALNTVGYAEPFAYLAGEIDEAEMVRLLKRNTRRYAKRQMTWFSADRRVLWIPPTEEAIFQVLQRAASGAR
jgi:tRNA dimethylallyltransferase